MRLDRGGLDAVCSSGWNGERLTDANIAICNVVGRFQLGNETPFSAILARLSPA